MLVITHNVLEYLSMKIVSIVMVQLVDKISVIQLYIITQYIKHTHLPIEHTKKYSIINSKYT